MEELLKTPVESRDLDWEKSFLANLANSQFRLIQDTPILGPDNMPYLPVEIVDEGEPAEAILNWLGEKGIGMVINPSPQPDYVLTFGMVWNYLLRKEFITEAGPAGEGGDLSFEQGQQVFAGTPNEEFFPNSVRAIFKNFLLDQGLTQPRIVMLSVDGSNFDLCFSKESLGDPPKTEWQGILEGFSWFFPLHYSFSIMSESSLQENKFVPL